MSRILSTTLNVLHCYKRNNKGFVLELNNMDITSKHVICITLLQLNE